MDEIIVATETDVVDLPIKHQLGKMAFSSVVAFAANHLADKAYDSALRRIRARKS